ncbi:cache domain-containing sensor histidine kinase [Diplocloster modestus]|uniref:histidine kinase n=1 Tax=Diplocloster modestus TaxID=2850322 RepID=A0ABS6K5W8_9FIRM|nr:sensor histidine kinase [Diplocloster modestus]MBU9725895.1 histidine kinase [Diplocloster modestus]
MKQRSIEMVRSMANNIRLRTKIFLYLTVCIFVTILILSFSVFDKSESVLNSEYGETTLQVLKQINNNIDYRINNLEVSFNSFYAGERFEDLLLEGDYDYEDMLVYFEAVKKQIETFRMVNEDILDIRIFSYDDHIPWDNYSLFSAGEIMNEDWARNLLRGKESEDFYWTDRYDDTGYLVRDDSNLYCYTAVFNVRKNNPLAILRMDVDKNKIFKALDTVTLGKEGVVFVVKGDGSLIYRNQESKDRELNSREKLEAVKATGQTEGVLKTRLNGKKEFLVFSCDNALQWYVIGSLPSSEFAHKTNQVRNFILLVSSLIWVLGLIFSYFFAQSVTQRITALGNVMDEIAAGDLEAEVNIEGRDEAGQLALHLKEMITQIQGLIVQLEEQHRVEQKLQNEKYSLEIMKKEAELYALQTQINPHFLYNTLEMIKGLLYSENPQKNIITAIGALSGMFRYNLNTEYTAKIRDELTHIRNYLTIHNLRFDEKVILQNRVDERFLDRPIVRFSFEPIIENAIVHGFRDSTEDNTIEILSVQEHDILILKFTDDGQGMDPQRLSEIQQRLAAEETNINSRRKGGIGICNVNERIKKRYGAEYGIRLESRLGVGTTVSVFLPVSPACDQGWR